MTIYGEPGSGKSSFALTATKCGKVAFIDAEKKIGKVKSLLDIVGIDDYAFSLDFSPTDLYMVEIERLDTVYEAITILLDHDQIKDEWYDDADGTLKDRISRFMAIMRVQKIEDKDGDGIPDHLDDQIG
jgi:hypothetical protein